MRPAVACAILIAAALTNSGSAVAQEPTDSAHTAAPDSLSPREALRERQRQLLLRLARAPGEDTLGLGAFDTIPQTSVRGAPGATSRARSTAGPATDSVARGLLEALPGYQAIEYQAQSAFYDALQGDLFLYGDTASRPTVRYQGQVLSADSLIHFRQPNETVEACCATLYVPVNGDQVQSERLVVSTSRQEASAYGAEMNYNEGAVWSIYGDLPLLRDETVFGSHAQFTSCTLEVPHYHFETDELKIVRGSILVARPVRLYFGGVPVAWLPFIAQSLSQGRASGILTPVFSVNDIVRSTGSYRRRVSNIGFYWAMNDYMDATAAFDWFSGNFTALTGGLTYRWLRQFMSGRMNVRQYWRQNGSTSLALDAGHQWEISERTRMNVSVSYASSTSLVREYSFNPQELTQQIRSQGGFSRRFDWGHLSLSGSRAQSISDDRVNMTLPNASLSLNSITLFPAPLGRSSWYNNLTWSGGARYNRDLIDHPEQATDSFRFALADQGTTTASANQSLSLGNFSLSQSARYRQGDISGVPRDSLSFFPSVLTPEQAAVYAGLSGGVRQAERVDVSQAQMDWSVGLGYQQTLIGSTTLTPSLSLSGRMLRSDTTDVAQSFVSGPVRPSFGATLRSDIYGFFPGVGAFEAIRHKISPSISYDWQPAVEPTELQKRVLGSNAVQPTKLLRLSISQTFEAKRPQPTEPAPSAPDSVVPVDADSLLAPAVPSPDTLAPVLAPGQDTLAPPLVQPQETGFLGVGGVAPTRRPRGQVVNLLSLRTSAIAYDFIQADSAGDFLLGFNTTTLRNEISSDFLRGLTISFEHDLFKDSVVAGEVGARARRRSFDPRLRAANLGFSLNSNSTIFRWLGLGRGDPSRVDVAQQQPGPTDPLDQRSPTDETSIIPGRGRAPQLRQARSAGGRGSWDANFTYSLLRPRPGGRFTPQNTQSLQIGFNMSPTDSWDMRWRTSYDLEARQFNDHTVTLTRDLHRWQAHFDFYKTTTGNWAFRFEVSLIDNQDLKFDYQQRNLQNQSSLSRR